jgi:DNA-binding response OmpR family regulator
MTDRPKILVVDDEDEITGGLARFLERCGFAVRTAADGDLALEEIRDFPPDLIVLDILMPRMDGREVMRRLRAEGDWTPIIMLTQVTAQAERVFALNEGADDYIDKPFDAQELVARIQAVLRRVRGAQNPLEEARRLVCDELVLDRDSRQAFLDGRSLNLTPRAVTLLEYMMLHPLELLTRDRLLDDVWGWDSAVGDRAVDYRISELRAALEDSAREPCFIETVHREGYRFLKRAAKHS